MIFMQFQIHRVLAVLFLSFPLLARPALAQMSTGLPVSQASVTATGSTTARTLADRAASALTVEDFGAKGDCATDDTAAFNAYAEALRAGTAYQGYPREFALAHGRCYVLAGSVNLTALNHVTLDGHGSVLIGNVSGQAVLDAVQSPNMTFQNFSLISGGSARVGIQIGRALSGLSGAQSVAFHNVFLDGAWSLAAIYNRAAETSVYDNVFAQNRYNSDGAYGAVFDGDAYFPIQSQFSATYNPSSPTQQDALYGTSPNISFNENTVIGGTFSSYYGPGIWMSNFRGLAFLNPYVVGYGQASTAGPAAVLYFAAGDAPHQLTWKVHSEGVISSDIQFQGVQATPTLVGLDYENHIDMATGSSLSLGTGITSATVTDLHMRVASYSNSSARAVDAASNWSLSGAAWVPLTQWNGTLAGMVDNGSGPTFTGTLGAVSGSSLTLSSLNVGAVGNPGSISAATVANQTQGAALWTAAQLAGALPAITVTSANGVGGGAALALNNINIVSFPAISGGAGCSVGDTFNVTDAQSGGGVYGGGQAIYTVSTVSSGAVTGGSWSASSGNVYLWAKPMSASTTLTARTSTCTTLPAITLSGSYPNAQYSIINGANTLRSTLSITPGSGYTVTPTYAFSPTPSSPTTGGANISITISGSMSLSAGNGKVAFSSAGTALGTSGINGAPVLAQGALIDSSGVRTALTTSGYTVPANTSLVRFTQTSAIASATITLPTALADGQAIQFVNYAGAVTALTFSPAVGGWTNASTLAANTGLRVRWDATAAAWYREQ